MSVDTGRSWRAPTGQRGDTERSLTVDVKLLLCLLPEFDQASVIAFGDAGDVTAWVRVGPLAPRLDQLHSDVGEGPYVDARDRARRVLAPRLENDDRWPAYVPAATRLGVRSQTATPLRWADDDACLGVLNLYSTSAAEIDPSAPVVAEVVAAQLVRTLASLRDAETTRQELADSTVIGQACGLVMAWLDLSADDALAHVRRLAAQQDTPLVRVAEQMVRTSQPPSVRPR